MEVDLKEVNKWDISALVCLKEFHYHVLNINLYQICFLVNLDKHREIVFQYNLKGYTW